MVDLVYIWYEYIAIGPRFLFSNGPNQAYDLKVKVVDLEKNYAIVLNTHIFQTIRWIWFIFGMMIDRSKVLLNNANPTPTPSSICAWP